MTEHTSYFWPEFVTAKADVRINNLLLADPSLDAFSRWKTRRQVAVHKKEAARAQRNGTHPMIGTHWSAHTESAWRMCGCGALIAAPELTEADADAACWVNGALESDAAVAAFVSAPGHVNWLPERGESDDAPGPGLLDTAVVREAISHERRIDLRFKVLLDHSIALTETHLAEAAAAIAAEAAAEAGAGE